MASLEAPLTVLPKAEGPLALVGNLTTGVLLLGVTCDVFLEVGRFKVLELERIYQNRTGRNRLSQ